MSQLRVELPFLTFQLIRTKTVRRLDPLRVNIVQNKAQDPESDNASKLHVSKINSLKRTEQKQRVSPGTVKEEKKKEGAH